MSSWRCSAAAQLASASAAGRCATKRSIRDSLQLDDLVYQAGAAEEHFLSFVTPDDRLAGFLRLSLPGEGSPATGLPDLEGAAIIREVHVYGQSLPGRYRNRRARRNISGWAPACSNRPSRSPAAKRLYQRLAVISAVGTRRYYQRRDLTEGELYLVKHLSPAE